MEYNDFVLRISPASDPNQFVVSAHSATAGEASGSFTTPFSVTELENFVLKIGLTRRGVRKIQSDEWRAAQTFGEKLYTQLFSGDVRATFLASRNDALREGKGLRVKFIIDAPALANYPWEFLYDTSLGRFLSLYEATPFVRYVELPVPAKILRVAPPLRVLVIASSPRDYPALDLAREKNNLDSALADLVAQNQIAVDWLPTANLGALREQLVKRAYHIFHFIGHGGFDESAAPDGVLVFEDEGKRSRAVSGERLAYLLGNHPTLQLAVLNACEGARTSVRDPFAGTAITLVRSGGVAAVVAMQFEITDQASIEFSRGFYGGVASGKPIDAAVTQARLAIFSDDNDVEWATPVLYLRAPDGVIFAPLSPEEIARQRAEEERRERERREAERIAKEKADAEHVAREQEERERAAREQLEKDQLAREQERLAKQKAEADRLAQEQAEHERATRVAQLYSTAQQQFAQKNYTDAFSTLASLLALDPTNANALELKTKIDAARTEQERIASEKTVRQQGPQEDESSRVVAKSDTARLEPSAEKRGFLSFLWALVTFNPRVYGEIAANEKATLNAALLVLVMTIYTTVTPFAIISLLASSSGSTFSPFGVNTTQTLVNTLVGWVIGSWLFSFLSIVFGGKTTTGAMLRVYGFTHIFSLINIIPFICAAPAFILQIVGVTIGIRRTSNFTVARAALAAVTATGVLLVILLVIDGIVSVITSAIVIR